MSVVTTTVPPTATPTTTPTTRSLRSRLTTGPVWRVGAVAAVLGAIVTELFAVSARVMDVPMEAGQIGADTADDIFVGAFAFNVLLFSVPGTLLAMALARWARRPSRTFTVITVAITVLSLIGPLAAGATTTATSVTLALAHIVAAAVVIPPLTLRLAQER